MDLSSPSASGASSTYSVIEPWILDGGGELFAQVLPLAGQAGGFRPVGAADLPHFAHDHLRVVDEILIHFQPVFIGIQVYPGWFLTGKSVPLLQKQNVAGHFRASGILERIIGQANGPQ